MNEWKTYKLRDVVNILDYKRIPLSSRQREQRRGKYPYYGAQGIIDYINDYISDCIWDNYVGAGNSERCGDWEDYEVE